MVPILPNFIVRHSIQPICYRWREGRRIGFGQLPRLQIRSYRWCGGRRKCRYTSNQTLHIHPNWIGCCWRNTQSYTELLQSRGKWQNYDWRKFGLYRCVLRPRLQENPWVQLHCQNTQQIPRLHIPIGVLWRVSRVGHLQFWLATSSSQRCHGLPPEGGSAALQKEAKESKNKS